MSEYLVTTSEGVCLVHHGIFGMHWGKRNGPPYPLSDGAHSASEKKAGRTSYDSVDRKIEKDAFNEYVKKKKNLKNRGDKHAEFIFGSI